MMDIVHLALAVLVRCDSHVQVVASDCVFLGTAGVLIIH